MIASVAAAGLVLAEQQVRLAEHGFDWTTVDEQDRAHFHWRADVVNESGRDLDVDVTVDLLDDDDAVLYSDATTARIGASATTMVEHEGSLPYDRAADVVSFRFRVDPRPPEGR